MGQYRNVLNGTANLHGTNRFTMPRKHDFKLESVWLYFHKQQRPTYIANVMRFAA